MVHKSRGPVLAKALTIPSLTRYKGETGGREMDWRGGGVCGSVFDCISSNREEGEVL